MLSLAAEPPEKGRNMAMAGRAQATPQSPLREVALDSIVFGCGDCHCYVVHVSPSDSIITITQIAGVCQSFLGMI